PKRASYRDLPPRISVPRGEDGLMRPPLQPLVHGDLQRDVPPDPWYRSHRVPVTTPAGTTSRKVSILRIAGIRRIAALAARTTSSGLLRRWLVGRQGTIRALVVGRVASRRNSGPG